MKVLLVGSFRYEVYAPAFAYGFRQLGHEVVEIDYEQYHYKGGNLLASLHNRCQDRYHLGLMMRRYNQDIIDVIEYEKPELVFLYRCYHIYNSTLKAIKGKTVVMSYNNDDPFSGIPSKAYYRHHIRNARYCSLNYVYRERNVKDYAQIGIENTKILLPYYLSWQNKPFECEKDIPIAFLGHFENDGRDKYILGLREAGVPVVVYGDAKWKEAPLYEAIRDVVYPDKRGKEYNLTINRCQVCLVFFSKINHDTYTRRCFEIPATKTVMLCEYTDDMNRLFPDGECAVYFRNEEELVKKAKELLNNDNYKNNIAQNAYARLQRLGGSEIDRCRQIIEDFNKIYGKWMKK